MPRYADLSQYSDEEREFWMRFAACAGRTFTTARGLSYSFELRGNEVVFERKSKPITPATIIRAYRNTRALTQAGILVDGPKKIGVFGASYLFPVFRELNLC